MLAEFILEALTVLIKHLLAIGSETDSLSRCAQHLHWSATSYRYLIYLWLCTRIEHHAFCLWLYCRTEHYIFAIRGEC